MCGIFAYSGSGNAVSQVVKGLKKLEYRGYDSWGVSTIAQNSVRVYKDLGAIGGVSALEETHVLPPSEIAIGHTRWATHGAVNLANCHPHLASGKGFSLAHNGIVENYQRLKSDLIKRGHRFQSDTDTEVIVRLIEQILNELSVESGAQCMNDRFAEAVRQAFNQLTGRNTLIVLNAECRQFVGIKDGSPLILGRNGDAIYLASDVLAIAEYTKDYRVLKDRELVSHSLSGTQIQGTETGNSSADIHWQTLDISDVGRSKEGHPHFMIKEIFEQWSSIATSTRDSRERVLKVAARLNNARQVWVTGAGGAYFTACQIAYYLRTLASVPAQAIAAYEVQDYRELLSESDVMLAISQSGETADTLDALELARSCKLETIALLNCVGSSMSLLVDQVFLNRCGPEICVLSTKSASSQIAFGYHLALACQGEMNRADAQLDNLSQALSLRLNESYSMGIKEIAKNLHGARHVYVLGRGAHQAVAQIAALNIKEASYIHAEAFSAGELKHGVIALLEPGTPVILFVNHGDAYMINVAAELKSRGAHLIAIGTKTNELFDEFIELPFAAGETGGKGTLPSAGIADIIPCQLLAYHCATLRGHNPDKPRNLAKSVTVR